MPLLNPPEIIPEAMRYLLRALHAVGGTMSRGDLVSYVAPEGLGAILGRTSDNGAKIAKDSISALRALELVSVQGNGDDAQVSLKSAEVDWMRLDHQESVTHIYDAVLGSTSLDGALEQTTAGADVLLGAAVLSVGDGSEGVTPCHAGAFKDAGSVQTLQFDQADRVIRPEPWQSLKRWMIFLGLARRDLHDPNRVLADPTIALLRHRGEFPTGLIRATEFVRWIGDRFPMLDGGEAFDIVNAAVAHPVPEQQFSRPLSLALLTLERSGHVAMQSGDDSAVWRLSGAGDRTVTHLDFGANS